MVVAIITYFSLIVGELVPKQIALRDPERVGDSLADAGRSQELRQPFAERGAGKGAGEDADQGDADLHRGQELAGI
ncbi:hypothetical protein [Mesorhizobium sp. M7A.F.Ca.US.001.04.2.1]|uniref:hypothetical protein n=1 Tax=Mesorhizobium sp. M7A.F.Ca.US.001.04.2.1 TaxID=2496727 RepID=UPI0032AE9F09